MAIVLVAQLLLIGTATGWLIHMVLIAKYGGILCMEPNSMILYGEIVTIVLIVLLAAIVFILQWKRLGERRTDDRGKSTRK